MKLCHIYIVAALSVLSPAHMSGSAAWRQLMTRFCDRSSRVRASGERSSSAVGLASRGEMYQTDLMFVACPSGTLLSASSLPLSTQLIQIT